MYEYETDWESMGISVKKTVPVHPVCVLFPPYPASQRQKSTEVAFLTFVVLYKGHSDATCK